MEFGIKKIATTARCTLVRLSTKMRVYSLSALLILLRLISLTETLACYGYNQNYCCAPMLPTLVIEQTIPASSVTIGNSFDVPTTQACMPTVNYGGAGYYPSALPMVRGCCPRNRCCCYRKRCRRRSGGSTGKLALFCTLLSSGLLGNSGSSKNGSSPLTTLLASNFLGNQDSGGLLSSLLLPSLLGGGGLGQLKGILPSLLLGSCLTGNEKSSVKQVGEPEQGGLYSNLIAELASRANLGETR